MIDAGYFCGVNIKLPNLGFFRINQKHKTAMNQFAILFDDRFTKTIGKNEHRLYHRAARSCPAHWAASGAMEKSPRPRT
jgi:hypothetical protein